MPSERMSSMLSENSQACLCRGDKKPGTMAGSFQLSELVRCFTYLTIRYRGFIERRRIRIG